MTKAKTIQQKAEIVQKILDRVGRHSFTISTRDTDKYYERLCVTVKRHHIFASDIREIEEKTGLHLHVIEYWNEPDICEKYPNLPKYMAKNCDGQSVKFRFARRK